VNAKVQELKKRHMRRHTTMADAIFTKRRLEFSELHEEEEEREAPESPTVVVEALDQ